MMTPTPASGAPGEVTGLASAQAYAGDMAQAYATAVSGAASFAAGLGGYGVDGPAVAAAARAQELTAQAGAAWAEASGALDRQGAVRDAYATAPETGSKAFVTGASSPADPAAMSTSRPQGTVPAHPRAVRIKTGDTEQADVVVTAGQGIVRVELAADGWELDEGIGPVVLLDEPAVAALVDAGTAMAAAESAARAAHRKLDAAIGRLEQRREKINNRPYETDDRAALSSAFSDLSSRGDVHFVQMRQRRQSLDADARAAFDDLESQLTDGDRSAIRAAQRDILHAAGFSQDDPYFTAQVAFDDLSAQRAEIRRQVEALPVEPLTAQEAAELERIATEIDAAEAALIDMGEERLLAAGEIPTQDGSFLAWSTTSEEGRVRHRLDRRPAGGQSPQNTDEGIEIPRLTGKQLRQMIRAVTHARGQ